MRYRIAAALLLFLGSAVMVAAGAGFACYAIYATLLPFTGDANAAAIAAAILLFIPVAGIAILATRARSQTNRFEETLKETLKGTLPPTPDNVTLVFLSGLARDKPLVAVLLAGIFGAATALLRDKK
jgi:hypothetical protein